MTSEQIKQAGEALDEKKKSKDSNGEEIDTRTVSEDIDVLLGNGKRLKVFIGSGEEGADENGVREFHFVPVPIGQLPELIKCVNQFQMMLVSGGDDEIKLEPDDVEKAARIAELSTERTDKVTKEQAKNWFSFSVITKLVRIAYSINEIEDQIGAISPTTLMAAQNRIRRQRDKMEIVKTKKPAKTRVN